jgi:hypothetical protein
VEWSKDPVLRKMEERAKVHMWWLAVLSVCLIGLFLSAVDAHHMIHRVAERPVISTASLADAEWREVGRRLDALEKPAVTQPGTSVSLNYDPDVFAIDAKGRLTLKVAPARTTQDQCIVPSIRVFQPDTRIDTRRPGETR